MVYWHRPSMDQQGREALAQMDLMAVRGGHPGRQGEHLNAGG
jgi:hypothetical protein